MFSALSLVKFPGSAPVDSHGIDRVASVLLRNNKRGFIHVKCNIQDNRTNTTGAQAGA